jgi:kynurenine formamidase
MRAAAWIAALLLAPACATPERAERIVDLTHPFGAETIYWPTEPGFVLERGPAGVGEGGYYYEAHRFSAPEHGGTHLDAPIHFHAAGQRVDEIPVERLVGPGVVVDVEAACQRDPDHQVELAELHAWEVRHGAIPRGAIVLIHTGFARRWPDRAAYLGTSERGPAAVAKLHFPGLGAEAARWLVAERAIRAVGLDTASIDHGPSQSFETHQALFAANVPALENVASLELLPPRGFRVVALPMKIRGGSGAPLRIVALVPDDAP